MKEKEQEKQVFLTALRLLTATPKSRCELRTRLLQRGFDSQILDKVLDSLEKEGLLNDRNLAQSVFRTFSTFRPSGRRRIAFEMKKKGLRPPEIQEVLEQYRPEEERERALDLARRKQERWGNLSLLKRRKRIYDFLIRRGFNYELSRDVIREVEKNS